MHTHPTLSNPQVETKSIPQIAAELARLQQLAAASKLGAGDLSGGSLTISNIGGCLLLAVCCVHLEAAGSLAAAAHDQQQRLGL